MTITALPSPPTTTDPTNFATRADAFVAALPTFVTEANATGAAATSAASTATTAAATAADAKIAALAAANFKGAWSTLTGPAAVPYSVSYSNRYWMLLSNISDITVKLPGTATEWQEITVIPSYAKAAISVYIQLFFGAFSQ